MYVILCPSGASSALKVSGGGLGGFFLSGAVGGVVAIELRLFPGFNLCFKVPIMSKNVFGSSNSTFYLMNFCEKIFDLDKTRSIYELLESSKFYFLPVEPCR